MKFTLTIDCDGPAFEETETEVAAILLRLSNRISNGELPCHDDSATLWLRDRRSNRVGTARFTGQGEG